MTRLPVCDEAWYANPAFNLTAGRSMGTTVLESAGTTLQGLERHTYWIMPLHIVGQALVYEVFGPGLMQTRLLSAFWGLVILGSWFVILRAVYPERLVALLAIFLMAIEEDCPRKTRISSEREPRKKHLENHPVGEAPTPLLRKEGSFLPAKGRE